MNARFEKYAREKLGQHELEVDTEALWADIHPHVQPNSGNRKIFWVFLSGLLIGLAGFGIFFWNTTADSSSEPITTINQNTVNDPITSSQNNEIKTPEQTIASLSESDEKSSTESDQVSNIINETEESPLNFSTSKVQNTQNSNTSPKPIARTTKEANVLSQNGMNTKVESPDEPISMAGIVLDEEEDGIEPSFTTRSVEMTASLPSLWPEELSSVSNSTPELPEDTVEEMERQIALLERAAAKQPAPSRRNTLLSDIRFGVGLYTGVGRTATDLNAKNESADDYVLLRTNSEKQLETLHFGLSALIMKNFNKSDKSIYLRTGLEYSRVASLFSREAMTTEVDIIQDTIEIRINTVTMDTTYIEGPVEVTKVTTFNKKTYNYFHMLDVPIILGYSFGNEPWTVGIEGGVYANVFLQRKGDISLPDESFYDLDEDANKWYKNSIGITPYIGFNAAYNVSDNIQIHVSPNFRFNNVFSASQNPIEENKATLGVLLGARYIFD